MNTFTSSGKRIASAASGDTAFTSIGICPVVFAVIQKETVTPSCVGTFLKQASKEKKLYTSSVVLEYERMLGNLHHRNNGK
jgi:hypothetical protein